MGIRYLNKYIRDYCPQSMACVSLSELSGKKIAVDISIYLYKYESENMLLENIYLMLSILREYNIIPIFIFDGKSPMEKKQLIQKRQEQRVEAEEEYKVLQQKLKEIITEEEKTDIMDTLDQVKRKLVYITKEKITSVKMLIEFYGATYMDANGEADELCALLVKQKKVWACLSEDMDMFVYGCSKILRYFSLINHTVVLYSMKYILKELDLTQTEFREICIISGTDYNTNFDENINLTNTMHYFNKYKYDEKGIHFYQWLKENTNYEVDINMLERINNMFDVNNTSRNNKIKDIQITNRQIQYDELKKHLYEEGFIF